MVCKLTQEHCRMATGECQCRALRRSAGSGRTVDEHLGSGVEENAPPDSHGAGHRVEGRANTEKQDRRRPNERLRTERWSASALAVLQFCEVLFWGSSKMSLRVLGLKGAAQLTSLKAEGRWSVLCGAVLDRVPLATHESTITARTRIFTTGHARSSCQLSVPRRNTKIERIAGTVTKPKATRARV